MNRRARRPRRLRFSLRKAMFVLPNLFTVSSIFCGLYAILLVSGVPSAGQLFKATLAVFFGIFFDMADGRVARLTRTQSDFGVQLDSLADMCTFGLAPAIVVHRWALADMGLVGVGVAFAYVACGALRLARFNVMAIRNISSAKQWFIGLPIPLAAGVLMALVMVAAQNTDGQPLVRRPQVVALTLILAYLMVSSVRYRAFKDVRVSATSLGTAAAVLSVFAYVASQHRTPSALLLLFCSYVALGLVEEVIFYRRRQREEQALPAAGHVTPTAAGGLGTARTSRSSQAAPRQ